MTSTASLVGNRFPVHPNPRIRDWRTNPWTTRIAALVLVLGLHAAGVWQLMQPSPPAVPSAPATPLLVQWIESQPAVPPPQRPPLKATPQPAAPQRPAAAPVPAPAPAPAAPVTTTAPSAPTATEVPQTAADPPAVPTPPAVAPPAPAPPVAAPVTPPSFNAAYLENPAPDYPMASRRLGEQGRVLLKVHVSAQGTPIQVDLERSSGHARLDRIAADTVRRWRFVPAKRGDEAVSGWVIVPIVFQLGG